MPVLSATAIGSARDKVGELARIRCGFLDLLLVAERSRRLRFVSRHRKKIRLLSGAACRLLILVHVERFLDRGQCSFGRICQLFRMIGHFRSSPRL